MRCAALHRKMGTHISRVKSLSMDSWTSDQVEVSYKLDWDSRNWNYRLNSTQAMKRVGNNASNQIYNPRHVKPSMPIDVDEVDMAMERFIRRKYQSKALSGADAALTARNNTGSTSSDDKPPPLPPKPGKRFGFGLRSSSSTFPQSRSAGSNSPVQIQQNGHKLQPSPPRISKASRVFGSNVASMQNPSPEDIATKLVLLRDMGFFDEERNRVLLKSLGGDVDRCVETLLRLRERSRDASSEEITPVPPPKNDEVNGITIEKIRQTSPMKSETPFDFPYEITRHGSAPINYQQSVSIAQPVHTSTNPFDRTMQPPATFQQLEQPFQNLQVSQQTYAQHTQTQPLFPNATGGYNISAQYQQHINQTPLQTQAHYGSVPNISALQKQQPMHSQMYKQRNIGGNPFLRTSHSQIFSSSNPFNTSMSSSWNSQSTGSLGEEQLSPSTSHVIDPFRLLPPSTFQQQPQSQMQGPVQDQEQLKRQLHELQRLQQGAPQIFSQSLPFPQSSNIQQQPNPMMQSQQNSQLVPKVPFAHDKSSILALYNYPHLAPSPTGTAEGATTAMVSTSQPLDGPVSKVRSVTMPLLPASSPSNKPVLSLKPISNSPTPLPQQATSSSTHTTDSSSTPSGATISTTSLTTATRTAQNSRNPFTTPAVAAITTPSNPLNGLATASKRNNNNTDGNNNDSSNYSGNAAFNYPDRQLSRESVDFAGLMAAGRHSPDAFAGLSARFV